MPTPKTSTVKFWLPKRLWDKNPNLYNDVLRRSLGFDGGEYHDRVGYSTEYLEAGVEITCTSDQFVRFLQMRNQAGVENFMQALKFAIGSDPIMQKEPKVDVSRRMARAA